MRGCDDRVRAGWRVKVGVIVPQGWTGEYDGWDADGRLAADRCGRAAGRRARASSRSGSSTTSTPFPDPTDEITFESFTTLAALAAATEPGPARAPRHLHRLPQPGARRRRWSRRSTSISGGRMELGIGAGWKRDEWRRLRLRLPRDAGAAGPPRRRPRGHHPDARAGQDGHATFDGRHASVDDAINVPKPLQEPRVPIMVGGNGPNVTWRLAARFADELNLDGLTPDEVARGAAGHPVALRGDRPRPGSLRVSVHISRHDKVAPGQERIDRLGGLPRAGRRADHRIPPGLGARPGRARGLRRRHGPGRLRPARRLAGSPGTPRSRSDLRDHERRTPGTSCHPSASRWIWHPSAQRRPGRRPWGERRLPGCRNPTGGDEPMSIRKATAFLSIAAVAFAACSGGGATPAASSAAPRVGARGEQRLRVERGCDRLPRRRGLGRRSRRSATSFATSPRSRVPSRPVVERTSRATTPRTRRRSRPRTSSAVSASNVNVLVVNAVDPVSGAALDPEGASTPASRSSPMTASSRTRRPCS